MIVYSALAQSLIEAAARPPGRAVPRFADLVLLVNPAVEAARYLPIQVLVEERRAAKQNVAQPPVFVCATAKNDWATGWAFPIGNAMSLVTESYKGSRERQAILHTIGHLSWMKTHDLSAEAGNYVLNPPEGIAGEDPFWVVQATPAVIDGHNGIFQPPFLKFIAKLVLSHVSDTAARAASQRGGGRQSP